MKFILKAFSFLVLIAILLAAVWFVTDEAEHKSIYDNTVGKLTSKTYDETFIATTSLDNVKGDTVVEHSKRHSDPNYVCPMHPQIVKGEEGSCPICGMDLVLKEADLEEEVEQKPQASSQPSIDEERYGKGESIIFTQS